MSRSGAGAIRTLFIVPEFQSSTVVGVRVRASHGPADVELWNSGTEPVGRGGVRGVRAGAGTSGMPTGGLSGVRAFPGRRLKNAAVASMMEVVRETVPSVVPGVR